MALNMPAICSHADYRATPELADKLAPYWAWEPLCRNTWFFENFEELKSWLSSNLDGYPVVFGFDEDRNRDFVTHLWCKDGRATIFFKNEEHLLEWMKANDPKGFKAQLEKALFPGMNIKLPDTIDPAAVYAMLVKEEARQSPGEQPVVTPSDKIAEKLFELLEGDGSGPHYVARLGERSGSDPYSAVIVDGTFDLHTIARELQEFIEKIGDRW
jgi:hypothetical protein